MHLQEELGSVSLASNVRVHVVLANITAIKETLKTQFVLTKKKQKTKKNWKTGKLLEFLPVRWFRMKWQDKLERETPILFGADSQAFSGVINTIKQSELTGLFFI